ncbi:MAG: TraR/DksA C4-type zinc finger protein [Ottowia sp.]|jgi:DnaK suppressor protein|nr:TraR/DksA C4-type zinc finger protein [Ottowia sp.]MBP7455338.1 TraR/DksA C4-type zinc finger protein [Ottowia sp.]MBP7456992.1 TraR/DksA C4-type zinc finger protein [Ottowia sp.]MBP8160870.1 TraR/DksA C4-type zinc finger protein [Ottowia sp.]MBP8861633.1 TraR/DksA C4-type zinc finger protein [Ottowia sp.]
MTQALTAPQRDELKQLLLTRRKELQRQMTQNLDNLAPSDSGDSVSQDDDARLKNQTREVDGALTAMDADELARIDRALEAMDDGEYGVCVVCGKDIPFERLKVEPMTQHCIVDKAKLEQQARA